MQKVFRNLILVIALISILAISACVEFPWAKKAEFEYGITKAETKDMSLSAEAVPTEIKSERKMTLYFDFANKQDTDLENIYFLVYDRCLFVNETPDSGPLALLTNRTDSTLKANRTESWKVKYELGDVSFERDCEIRFKIDYQSELKMLKGIAVLKDSEYYQREEAGTLGEITIQSSSTSNPLVISISFSDSQPFLDGDEIYMYINYANTGDGFLDYLDEGSVEIDFPGNINDVSCNDYYCTAGNCVLKEKLKFIRGSAPKSTCSFTTAAQQPVDVRSLTLTARYKYMLDNSIKVKIKP